jgi:predicted transport protein
MQVDQMEATMIANLETNTEKTLDEWIAIARASKARQPVGATASTGEDLVNAQYSDAKADLRPIYDDLVNTVISFGDDVEISPKKTYVSLRRNKQFAIVQPSTKTRVDVGVNLKGVDPTERLEASGSFNAMVSHRVRLTGADQVDDELIGWLNQAYQAA